MADKTRSDEPRPGDAVPPAEPRRPPARAWVAAAALLVVTVVAGVLWWTSTRGPGDPEAAPSPTPSGSAPTSPAAPTSPVAPTTTRAACPALRTVGRLLPVDTAGAVTLTEASYTMTEPDEIYVEWAGRVRGTPPAGTALYLVGSADPGTRRSDPPRAAGDDTYRLVREIRPDRDGCWSTPRREVDKGCGGGLTYRYFLASVPVTQAADLLALQDTGTLRGDGHELADIERRGVTLLSRFDVPTKPNC